MGELQNIIITDRAVIKGFQPLERKAGRTQEIAAQLSQYVVGQEHAISAVAKALSLAEAGLNDPDRPIAIFFFTGPTGVGKTELARTIARVFCGGEDRITIVDCAEYGQQHTVHNLTGSPPGYIGANEQGKIPHNWLHAEDESNQRKRTVVVLDEIEKAHPDLQQLFLGVMDRGTMDAREGDKGMQPLDFRNTVLVFTSNAGAHEIQHSLVGKTMGFVRREGGEVDVTGVSEVALKALEVMFRPEFLNRIGRDRTLVFAPLKEEQFPLVLARLIEAKNRQIRTRLHNEGKAIYQLYATKEFAKWIVSQIDSRYGARDLRNVLETRVYPMLAECLTGKNISEAIVIDFSEGELLFLKAPDKTGAILKTMSA